MGPIKKIGYKIDTEGLSTIEGNRSFTLLPNECVAKTLMLFTHMYTYIIAFSFVHARMLHYSKTYNVMTK